MEYITRCVCVFAKIKTSFERNNSALCVCERAKASKERMEYKNGKWELKEKAKNGDVVRLKIKLTIELKKRNKINKQQKQQQKNPIGKYETTKPFICDSTLEIRCSVYLFARSSQQHKLYAVFIHSAILKRGWKGNGSSFWLRFFVVAVGSKSVTTFTIRLTIFCCVFVCAHGFFLLVFLFVVPLI